MKSFSTLLGLALLSTAGVAAADIRRAPEPIAGKYIVVMKDGVSAVKGAQATARFGGRVDQRFDNVKVVAASMTEAEALALSADADVAFVEEDGIVRISAAGSQTQATWGIDRIDQPALPLSTTYAYRADGTGVTAYVVDTGLRATHAEFTGRVGAGYTAINDGQGTNDCNQHGTHVAGTVAGSVLGVAKKARVVPVRVLGCDGSGTTAGIIAGLDWIAANAAKPAVANMSLGGGASDASDQAVQRLVAAGVTVVVAAGNENQNACNVSPAREPSAITVGATDMTDRRATFSNFGTCVDIFAPGVDIFAASYAADNQGATLSGTSMASPHVAGAAALFLSTNPTATPAQVAAALVAGSISGKVTDPVGSPNKLLQIGFIGELAPEARITSPQAGQQVPRTFTVRGTATDDNLSKVEILIDGQLVDTSTDAAFQFSVTTTLGLHDLEVVATDAAGLVSSTTSTVNVVEGATDPDPIDDGNDPTDPSNPSGGPNDVIGGCSTGGGSLGFLMALGALGLVGRRRR